MNVEFFWIGGVLVREKERSLIGSLDGLLD